MEEMYAGTVRVSETLLDDLKLRDLLHIRGLRIFDFLTDDVDILEGRNRMLFDLVHIPGFGEHLRYMVRQLLLISEMVSKQSVLDEEERSLYSVKQLETYFDIIDKSAVFHGSRDAQFTSDVFAKLFARIAEIAVSQEYTDLKKGTAKLLAQITSVKSVSVGFNFDAALTPYEAGIVSINRDYIQSGELIDRILRADFTGQNLSLAPLVQTNKQCREDEMAALERGIYTALNKIFKKLLRQWEPKINGYIADKLRFMQSALPELQFILQIYKIQTELQSAGLPLCRPRFFPKEEKVFRARQFYNPVLALKLKESGQQIVRNDFQFDADGQIYLLEGPNNGGKSVFLAGVCILQILAQLGMLVPARELDISPADGIFLHMQTYNPLNESGRLAEECRVIAEMFGKLTEASVCFFDEAFSSTDNAGAMQLSDNVLRALSTRGIRCIFNTHIHELADHVADIHEMGGAKIDYLTAQILEGERRSYRVERCRNGAESYAHSIARKFGLTYEALTGK